MNKKTQINISILIIIKILIYLLKGIVPFLKSIILIKIINSFEQNFEINNLIFNIFLLSLIYFIERFLMLIIMPLDSSLTNKLRLFEQYKLAHKIKNSNFQDIETPKYQEKLKIVSSYIDSRQRIIDLILNIATCLITIISLSFILYKIKWYILLILIAGVIPIAFLYNKIAFKNYKLNKDLKQKAILSNYYYSLFSQNASNREIKIYDNGEHILNEHIEIENYKNKLFWKNSLSNIKRETLFKIPFTITYIISILLSIYFYFELYISLAILLSSITIMRTYQNSVRTFINYIFRVKEIKYSLKEFSEFIEFKNECIKSEFKKELVINNSIKFLDVSYKYENSERYALKNINLNIEFGKTIFIVGENGSGKTTLIKLLTGLYIPTQGNISYDNNILDYNTMNIFNNFSCVFQDFIIYPFSIKENIILNNEFNELKYNNVLHLTKIDEIINKEGITDSTILGKISKKGINLSNGQLQKIVLGRALYSEKNIYIFDEPTSSLDPIAEIEIYKLYNDLFKNKTKIIISHRLGYAKYADTIIVLKNGEIVETGTYKELTSKKGIFNTMLSIVSEES